MSSGTKPLQLPGTLKGLWEAHERFGTMPWKEVMAPAIDLARK